MSEENKDLPKVPENEKDTSDLLRFLVFALGEEEYAIPLLSVKEVIALPEFTKIPQTPSHFLGIMNLRGQVISVMDLRLKFGIKAATTSETVVIICDLPPLCLGIVVNRVDSVLSIPETEIQPRPEFDGKKNVQYVTGVTRKDKKLVLLLDIASALDVQDRVAMKDSLKHSA